MKYGLWSGLVLFVIFAAPAATAAQEATADAPGTHLETADSLLDVGDPHRALRHLWQVRDIAIEQTLSRDEARNLYHLTGIAYASGTGADEDEAVRYLRKSAEMGLPAAALDLGLLLFRFEKFEQSREVLIPIAESTSRHAEEARVLLGVMYVDGKGVAVDRTRALELFRQAGDHPAALTYLGSYYQHGVAGLDVDLRQALTHYRAAASQNYADAWINIGILYSNEREQDMEMLAFCYANLVLDSYRAGELIENLANSTARECPAEAKNVSTPEDRTRILDQLAPR